MPSPIFLLQKGRRSIRVQFYVRLSSLLVLLLSPDQCRIEARTARSLTKTACLHSSKQKKRLSTVRGGGPWGERGKSPFHFLCPMQERFGQQELAFASLWQLQEAVMSAILGWTVQCAVRRHLSSFSP